MPATTAVGPHRNVTHQSPTPCRGSGDADLQDTGTGAGIASAEATGLISSANGVTPAKGSASTSTSNHAPRASEGKRPLSVSAPAAEKRSNAVLDVLRAMEENGSTADASPLLRLDELRQLLEKPELIQLVEAYYQLEDARLAAPSGLAPFLADDSLRQMRDTLRLTQWRVEESGETASEDAADQVSAKELLGELVVVLSKPHLCAVMETFDEVDQQRQEAEEPKPLSPLPMSPVLSTGGGNGERALKQVGIRRNPNEKLGIVMKLENNEVVISRILVGLGADRQGLLHVGDVVVEVDGMTCAGNLEIAEEQIRKAEGSFTIKLIPSPEDAEVQTSLFYRALFDYDPTEDKDHPYQSGGLSFKNGDILEVVNAQDSNWWQARIAGNSDRKTGLIPGRPMQERRLAAKRNQQNGSNGGSSVGCMGMRKNKSKTVMYSSANNADFDRHEIITYEEVVKAPPSQRNVIALIGAQGVGRRGLKYRLIDTDKERYATTLPTTSRPKRENEADGVQYYFTDNDTMTREVKSPAYLESGEYNGYLYGTKTESVRDVIKDKKVCLLDVNPNALKRLRNGEFKPYIIFIKAPEFDTLKAMHREAAQRHGQESANNYTDQDLQRTLNESEHIEKLYRHMFDTIVVNDNIEEAFHKLQTCIQKLDADEQWVPACWMV